MMTRLLFLLWVLSVTVAGGKAQALSSLFQPLTWEEASLRAARESKLVLVEMGPVGTDLEKVVRKDRAGAARLGRQVIAIRMDAASPEGQAFLPRLLMYEPPYYAFFMPYGDLVGGLPAEEAAKHPQALPEALDKALGMAEVKRRNSRSIRFADLPPEEALRLAAEQEKPVFVALHKDNCQPCLLMEKNVYRLDRTADFYNGKFINLQLNERDVPAWTEKYKLTEFPAFLYLNADGKLLGQTGGYRTAEQLLAAGRAALEKAAGIAFDTLPLQEAEALARQTGKLIFTDYYTPGSGHTELVKKVFADPEVNDFFTAHFINLARESGQNEMVFSDAQGNELHRVTDVGNVASLLEEAGRAIEGKGVAGLRTLYREGRRTPEFMEEYTRVLYRAGQKEEASEVAMEYLAALTPECLKTPHYWEFFRRYVSKAEPAFFDFLLTRRPDFYSLYGKETVSRKISDLWIVGAESFVRDGVFDEVGFKEYTKRLKKEKAEGWRSIVRNARMHAAEKTGDWKTYVTLAEEKWNEEKVTDAELYGWGMKIEQQCRDEGIRYIAARWFAERAREIERKERMSGKVQLTSYKGFFEKLVDDLVGK